MFGARQEELRIPLNTIEKDSADELDQPHPPRPHMRQFLRVVNPAKPKRVG